MMPRLVSGILIRIMQFSKVKSSHSSWALTKSQSSRSLVIATKVSRHNITEHNISIIKIYTMVFVDFTPRDASLHELTHNTKLGRWIPV